MPKSSREAIIADGIATATATVGVTPDTVEHDPTIETGLGQRQDPPPDHEGD